MKKLRGRWSPSPEQISLCIDCATARMPITRAAELLGIGPRTLWIFAKRSGLPIFAAWEGLPACVAGSRTAKIAEPIVQGNPSSGRRPLMPPRSRPAIAGASIAVWAKQRPWRARIYVGGKHLSLGYFASQQEARAAYAAAAKEFGLKLNGNLRAGAPITAKLEERP